MRHGVLGSLALALAATALASCDRPDLVSDTAAPAAAPAPVAETVTAPDLTGIPAGMYRADPMHASLVFRVGHMGFSNYTAQFKSFSADLQLDPASPELAQLTAVIDPMSLDLIGAPKGFREELLGPNWLDAGAFPQMVYRSTGVKMSGPDTATIKGQFTMHGVTQPVQLQAKFNGGYGGQTVDPQARIGFSATGVLKRSIFGIDVGVPTPPSKMGVADEVHVQIELEMLGPAWEGRTDAPAP